MRKRNRGWPQRPAGRRRLLRYNIATWLLLQLLLLLVELLLMLMLLLVLLLLLRL